MKSKGEIYMQFELLYTVQNPQGLHMQPATMLAKQAEKFKSTITIYLNNKSADLKKVFGIVGLGIQCGDQIYIHFTGEDAKEAYTAIKDYIEKTL